MKNWLIAKKGDSQKDTAGKTIGHEENYEGSDSNSSLDYEEMYDMKARQSRIDKDG